MVARLQLQGVVPSLSLESLREDAINSSEDFKRQLGSWGFMAAEIPGIGSHVNSLLVAFAAACTSTSPMLADYAATSIPQISPAGNHGFYKFNSEIPRLSHGVPDPKEFLHVSGAMLDDVPPGSRKVLQAFPELDRGATFLFDAGFSLAEVIGDVVRSLLPGESAPDLDLSRYSSTLRLIHYHNVDRREVLAHEHSGIQMLGVQFPPSDAGLQYILNDGSWVEPMIRGTDVVLCNIGRMLSEASGARIRPSTHRVRQSELTTGEDRWSTVLFAHPDHEVQQWRITEEGATTVFDATWGDFVSRGFRGLGLKT